MAHLINQSNRPAQLVLFFFIESFEAQDNSDKSEQFPSCDTPENFPKFRHRTVASRSHYSSGIAIA
jgi:hypothetical protein